MNGTMFRAILWKELRENLKWGVVVLTGMTAVLAQAMRPFPSMPGDGTTVGAIILAGLLIGVAQAIVENRGDRWGFLTHRPVSRTTLFWGKATAGILLYAISTGVPVAAALSWTVMQGNLPIPFDWKIALPAIANLLAGLVFYFAGFLTGMREARWYASRALGIGAAIWCLDLQMAVPEFWQAAAASAAGLILVGTAAWSTFVTGGQYGVQPRIGRVATGVSIGLGITLAGWIVAAVCVVQLDRLETPQESPDTYAITTEGLVVRITRKNGQIMEVSDPNGRPLEQYRTLSREQNISANLLSARLSQIPQVTPSFRSISRLFGLLSRQPLIGNELGWSWSYVHRLDLIAAYDTRSRKLIGWIGPDGFSPGEARPRSFPGPVKNRITAGDLQILVFEDAVYQVNLDTRRVEKIFQPEHAETILDASPSPRAGSSTYNGLVQANSGETTAFVGIATTRRVIVMLRDGTTILEVPQDAGTARYPILQVTRALQAAGVPTFLWYQGLAGEESRISEFNSTGAVVNSWTLPPTNRVLEKSGLQIAISSAIVPLIGQAYFEIAGGMDRDYSLLSRPARATNWVVAILSSLVSAVAVFLYGRRYAFSPRRLGVWTGITLLSGPIGFLLMLVLIEWPALESCPACSRKRVVTLRHCEHCREPFADPPKDGTEIFESMPARSV